MGSTHHPTEGLVLEITDALLMELKLDPKDYEGVEWYDWEAEPVSTVVNRFRKSFRIGVECVIYLTDDDLCGDLEHYTPYLLLKGSDVFESRPTLKYHELAVANLEPKSACWAVFA